MKSRKTIHWSILTLMISVFSLTNSFAQDQKAFLVKDGASPWFDRIGGWVLNRAPKVLEGNGSLPQPGCGSQALDVHGNPALILLRVSDQDLHFSAPAQEEFGRRYAGAARDVKTHNLSIYHS
jgi:hypothetical protein